MVVFNIKIDKKSVFKTILAIMFIICITLCIIGAYMLFTSNSKNELTQINDDIPSNDIAELTAENYTNVLQEVHNSVANIEANQYTNVLKEVYENVDTYIGQKISFIGYVYKADGFLKNQFVLARDMDIGNNQTLIVGFLCDYEKAQELELKSWIKITGEITKGEYNRFYNSYNSYNIFREFF